MRAVLAGAFPAVGVLADVPEAGRRVHHGLATALPINLLLSINNETSPLR